MPDSGWPCAAKCFSVAMTRFLSWNVASPWKPRTAAMPMRDHQVRIFAVGLLHAAPARLARHIHHGRERLVRAARAGFLGGHGEQRLRPVRDRRWRRGRWAAGNWCRPVAAWPCRHSSWKITGMPRRVFSMKNFWMALVSSAISRGVLAAAGIAGPADLAEAVSVLESRLGFLEIEVAARRPAACRPSAARRTSSGRPFPRASSAPNRSFTLLAAGSAAFLYGGSGCFFIQFQLSSGTKLYLASRRVRKGAKTGGYGSVRNR